MDLKTRLAEAIGEVEQDARQRRNGRQGDASWESRKEQVRSLVIEEVAPRLAGLDDDQKRAEVERAMAGALDRQDLAVSPRQQQIFMSEVLSDILGYGPLDELLADDTISEIMCNAHDQIWIERNGVIEESHRRFASEAHFRRVIDRLVREVGRRIDESSPMVDARMKGGGRLNAVIPPLAVEAPALTIRKASQRPLEVADLLAHSNWTPELALVLDACVASRISILVSGGTGSGKTTVLGVLSRFVPPTERIITIEDAAELVCHQPNRVALEARPANTEQAGRVSIRDLVRNALRMRPDRIIVGECRDGEALDMLQAMNTGHEGSMTTLHANSPRDALSRLETLVLLAGVELPMRAVKEQIAAAIDLVVHLERLPDGRRIVRSVAELQGMEGDTYRLAELFVADPDPTTGSVLRPTGQIPMFLDRIAAAGRTVPVSIFRGQR
jgi:pilus assembly protein CpaF